MTFYSPKECLFLVKQSLTQLDQEELDKFFNLYEEINVDFEQNIFNINFAITDHYEMYYHPLLSDDYNIQICECHIKHLNQYFYFRVDFPKYKTISLDNLDVFIVKQVEVIKIDYEVVC